jgi:hypothetical protein
MAVIRRLAAVLAVGFLIAVLIAPPTALAHPGHAHHAASAEKSAPPMAHVHHGAVLNATPADNQATAAFGTIGGATDCASHCCGGSAGMACCGAALAPDPFCMPLFRASGRIAIPDVLPSSGLPPEALPKPPKSFA